MQWIWTEDREVIKDASTAGCLDTWPETAEIKKRLEEGCKRHQRSRETSKPSASLPK